ncbi:hypothetical protein PAHAL_9G241500 [Panicum hallii]|jgi:hypothetical protein|uniref:Uncharacterized protein n=1 Tax=Panicum hallii TaxID=206008 RepID=A0A2T8I2B6_9POAL|nr:hypothetical protein PAHAL_9G241500 [Panicum hallii]
MGFFPLPPHLSPTPLGRSKIPPAGWGHHGRVAPAGGRRGFPTLQDSVAVAVLSSTDGGHRRSYALLLVNLQGFK